MVIKRDGERVEFDSSKIENAIKKAFKSVDGEVTQYAAVKAFNIAKFISDKVCASKTDFSVEQIQDMCEKGLMATKRKDVAKAYILYRNKRTRARGNVTDKEIDELFLGINEYWNTENSNKDAVVVSTQRDYLAGITSTDISRRKLLPEDIVEAHDQGIIHFHDIDYFAQNALTNCELCNLEDMLQNSTVINGVMIEKPHRFITAATIATQIILAVTSSTYGGCTITLTHLAPFVRDSYNYYFKKYKECGVSEDKAIQMAKQDTKKEIKDGVQTFNYQVNSMTNTNG